ncbi:hypothetical protein HZR84_00580 [Hyphobacterium sp. CCMP332]|nr:hypothetical protein HZR84_00580 [Hyphobacterium sp. CCMP332]
MTSIRIRPRFKKQFNLKVEKVEEIIKKELNSRGIFTASLDSGHFTIRIKPEDRHFWSPQLSLSFEENNGKTLIRGLYGPAPNVWTIFLLSYLAIGVLSLFALFLGLSYWMLGQDVKILWAMPVLGIIAIIVYLIAQFGQKLGAEQTFRLHQFIESCFHDHIEIE